MKDSRIIAPLGRGARVGKGGLSSHRHRKAKETRRKKGGSSTRNERKLNDRRKLLDF